MKTYNQRLKCYSRRLLCATYTQSILQCNRINDVECISIPVHSIELYEFKSSFCWFIMTMFRSKIANLQEKCPKIPSEFYAWVTWRTLFLIHEHRLQNVQSTFFLLRKWFTTFSTRFQRRLIHVVWSNSLGNNIIRTSVSNGIWTMLQRVGVCIVCDIHVFLSHSNEIKYTLERFSSFAFALNIKNNKFYFIWFDWNSMAAQV